jgi:glycerol-3-phosphate dehydrogenase
MTMEREFSAETRNSDLDSLEKTVFDAVIIGGGITGAGCANILSQIGLKTILIEKGDFASGTSSGSSKLIHGGLRYLDQGMLGLTRNLLKERNYLLEHSELVTPVEFRILTGPGSWKPWKIRLGLILYKMLGGKNSFPAFHKNEGEYGSGIDGYFTYMDAKVDDAELVIYNIVSAHNSGSVCLNYVCTESISVDNGEFRIGVRDVISGKRHTVSGRTVINAAGPWAAEIMRMAGESFSEKFRLSRGIHIIFRKDDLTTDSALAFRSSIDGRQIFIIPWEHVTVIGTTDTFVDGPDQFSMPENEVEYLLKSAEFVVGKLDREKIIGTYSGIRPLYGDGKTPGEISRDFSIVSRNGFISVLGGKITDYRRVSRRVAVETAKHLGLKVHVKGLPAINYSRKNHGDFYRHILKYECPLYPEDVTRRRTGTELFDPDRREAEMAEVQKLFMETVKEGIADGKRPDS